LIKIKCYFLEGFVSHFADLKFCFVFKNFFNDFGCSNIYYENTTMLINMDFRMSYILSSTLFALENLNIVFFLGLNMRLENPLINSRLRKNYLKNPSLKVCCFGLGFHYLSYPSVNFGFCFSNFEKFTIGKFPPVLNIFYISKFFKISIFDFFHLNKCIFFLGNSTLFRKDFNSFFSLLSYLKFNFKIY
jgi:Molybdopterin oxidoreductase